MSVQDLKVISYHGREQLQSKINAIGPYLSNMVVQCINSKRACNIVVTGEPGIGKKRSIQFERYEQGREEAVKTESLELTEKQIEDILEPHIAELLNEKGFLDVALMRLFLREHDPPISISSWKAYNIKRSLERRFKEKFGQ
jgi:hypothetical protein